MSPASRHRFSSRFLVRLALPWALLLLAACRTASPGEVPSGQTPGPLPESGPAPVSITLLHLNDVYEIAAIEGGRRGGLARVATLHRELLEKNPNTFLVHAGDMLSPSALGTAKIDGERLAGEQMVAVLNSLGLDVATFGNHEFDLDEDSFLARLDESRFQWISANVTDGSGRPFPGVERHTVLTVPDGAGGEVRLGIVGVTLEDGSKPYFRIADPLTAVRREVGALEDRVDILLALTHLDLDQDAYLAERVPELDLILGGHEHENYQLRRGADGTPILKGDANARSVFVHHLSWDPRAKTLDVQSELVPVDEGIAEDPAILAEVEKWKEKAYAAFRASGFEPEEVVVRTPTSLDGRESSVRNRPTNLTDLIVRGMLREGEAVSGGGAQAALLNGGSIRVDDVLPAGPLTQYDVIRILPFGGNVVTVRLSGKLLLRILAQGEANVGIGGFLQVAGAERSETTGLWEIDGQPIDAEGSYRVVVTDFLLTGRESGLGYLTPDNPELEVVEPHRDIRRVLIDQLRRTYGTETAAPGLQESDP